MTTRSVRSRTDGRRTEGFRNVLATMLANLARSSIRAASASNRASRLRDTPNSARPNMAERRGSAFTAMTPVRAQLSVSRMALNSQRILRRKSVERARSSCLRSARFSSDLFIAPAQQSQIVREFAYCYGEGRRAVAAHFPKAYKRPTADAKIERCDAACGKHPMSLPKQHYHQKRCQQQAHGKEQRGQDHENEFLPGTLCFLLQLDGDQFDTGANERK